MEAKIKHLLSQELGGVAFYKLNYDDSDGRYCRSGCFPYVAIANYLFSGRESLSNESTLDRVNQTEIFKSMQTQANIGHLHALFREPVEEKGETLTIQL